MNFISAGLMELARASRLFVAAAVSQIADSRLVASTAHVYYRVVAGDVAEGMLARRWVGGAVFAVCRQGVTSDNTVTVTSTGQVFACILSPGTAVTEEPTVQLAPEVFTSDGYGWRYLYTVTQAYREKFLWEEGVIVRPLPPLYTSAFETDGLPVEPIVGTPLCYLDPPSTVIPYAVKNVSDIVTAIMLPPGAIQNPTELYACVQDPLSTGNGATAVVTVNLDGTVSLSPGLQGTGYVEAKVTIVGDGVGASFTANTAGGGVVGYTQTSGGAGYTTARAIITAGANSAAVAAIIPSANADFTRTRTLLSKPLNASDTGASSLTAFLVVTEDPFLSPRASGPLGDSSVTKMTGEPLVVARISAPGVFSMTENIQINTTVSTG